MRGLALDPEPQRRGAGGDDDGLRPVFGAARPHPERALGEVDPIDVDIDEARPEALGLGAHRGHQLGALDALGEARVVLDVARQHQLAARRGAGQHDGLEAGARRVDRGGQPGRAGTDDQQLGVDPAAPARDGRRAAGGGRRGVGCDGDRRRGTGRPVSAEIDGQAAEWFVVLHDRYRSTFAIPPWSMWAGADAGPTAPATPG